MVNRHGWILAFALMLSGCVAYPGYYDTGYPAYPAYPDYAAAPYYYGPGYPYYGAWPAYGGFYGSFNYSYGRGCCWGHGWHGHGGGWHGGGRGGGRGGWGHGR